MARVALALVLVLAASAPLAGTTGAAGATPGPILGVAQADFDQVEFRIRVLANGSARWTFRYQRLLANESERRQFRGFADRFRANETGLYRDFVRQSNTLADVGQRATGRNMSVHAFDRRAYVTNTSSLGLESVGVVEMEFTWTGFARTNGSRVVVGDVFEGGLYIGPDQSLVIAAGDGLRFDRVSPAGQASAGTLADSDTVTWRGERTFSDNRPRVVLVATAEPTPTTVPPVGPTTVDATATAPPTTPGVASTTPTPATGGGLPGGWLVLAVVLLAGLGAAVLWRQGVLADLAGSAPTAPDPEPSTDSTPDEAAAGARVDDADRVLSLLREHDGRMRQSAIVEETEWSKSKVSMLLSDMEEEGQVTRIRVGRENLVALPGQEPDAAGSPYDE